MTPLLLVAFLAGVLLSGGAAAQQIEVPKLNGMAVLTPDDIRVPKLTGWAVLGSDLQVSVSEASSAAETITATGTFTQTIAEAATAEDFLTTFPAGGGGGGAAGRFGNGEDGEYGNLDGTGGYGGAADSFNTARQTTPGATGNTGTEFNGVVGSGSGGAGGNYNPVGDGQAGGLGGTYGGGGGGGGAGGPPLGGGAGGPGALGGEGAIFIQYTPSGGGAAVTVLLDKDSTSPWTVPANWSNTNTILILTAGGCGQGGTTRSGGRGGWGGDAAMGVDVTAYTPAQQVEFSVTSAAIVCNNPTPTTGVSFGEDFVPGPRNGDGTDGGGTRIVTHLHLAFSGGPGGPGGDLTTFTITTGGGILYRMPFTHWW